MTTSENARKPILAANWKMHKTVQESVDFVTAFLPLVKGAQGVDIVIAPPFTALERVGTALAGSAVQLAAQNVNPEEKGAFTGEVAPSMLEDVGCRLAIVGHSERRALFGESSEFVARKTAALLARSIQAIVCVGETLAEREADRAFSVIEEQLKGSLGLVPDDRGGELVIAYEPVWAIGTGKTATPDMAQEMHAFIRAQLGKRFPSDADSIRIQYGGSVKPDNVRDLMSRADIDGALVGGASLDPQSFAQIALFEA